MSAWDADDLATLLDADMPGHHVATIGAAQVGGLYRAPYADALGGLVGGNSPTFRAATADLAGVAVGTALTVAGLNYTVDAMRPVNLGHTVLILERA